MTHRGQLVLLAAVALAIALVPLALAHVQLGYSDDVTGGQTESDLAKDGKRSLAVGLQEAVEGIPASHDWGTRSAAITTVRQRLAPTRATVNRSGLDSGILLTVTYNQSSATATANSACPGGPNRQFGPCTAEAGVVVQERRGQTHVVATVFDITVISSAGELTFTSVISVVDDPH